MKNLKRQILSSSIIVGLMSSLLWANQLTGGQGSVLVMTKDLQGATGNPSLSMGDFSLAFAWGEPGSGTTMLSKDTIYALTSGYCAGRFGNGLSFTLLSSQIGQTTDRQFFQDQLRVGVPFNSP